MCDEFDFVRRGTALGLLLTQTKPMQSCRFQGAVEYPSEFSTVRNRVPVTVTGTSMAVTHLPATVSCISAISPQCCVDIWGVLGVSAFSSRVPAAVPPGSGAC